MSRLVAACILNQLVTANEQAHITIRLGITNEYTVQIVVQLGLQVGFHDFLIFFPKLTLWVPNCKRIQHVK